jgi:AAA15 family ATPase/GTPase
MIVEFSVKNFRSIRDLQTISFAATGLKSAEENAEVDTNNIAHDGGMRLLKTVGIYGANASGKSNLIRAIEYFIQAIKNEASSESNLQSLCDPFIYQDGPFETESFFQMVLILQQKKYRYGFTVKNNPDYIDRGSRQLVTNEWLYGTKEKNSGEYFTRKGLETKKETLPGETVIPALPYAHTLFITHAAAFDADGICAEIRNFLLGWTISNFTLGFHAFRFNTLRLIDLENRKFELLELLSAFNLHYSDVVIEKDNPKPNYESITHEKIFFIKEFINNRREIIPVKLNLRNTESAGTQKLFDIAGLLLRAFGLPISGFLIIDEIDSNFHPALLINLIGLFNNPNINKSKIQVLFTSHDTNLMSPNRMRRDQFYFTEKGEDEATRVYSLADLRGVRNDADFAKNYLAGFYGAVPVLEKFTRQMETQKDGTLEY